MEASDYYNLSIHELVISPFAVDWSQDNQISVLTEKGVHIFVIIYLFYYLLTLLIYNMIKKFADI